MSVAFAFPSENKGGLKSDSSTNSFVKDIGWKDEKELYDFVQIVSDVLICNAAPQNGWTWYKFEKEVYNTVRCSSHDTVRPEAEYKAVWRRLRTTYAELGKESGIPFRVMELLDRLKSFIDKSKLAFNILEDEKTRIWSCPSVLFPHSVRHKFEPPPTSSARSSQHEFPTDTFSGAPLLIANMPLPAHMKDLWEESGPRLCADGGANRLFSWSKSLGSGSDGSLYVPSAIVGDFDSIKPEIEEHFVSHGSEAIKMSGQDNTDLDKTLDYFDSLPKWQDKSHVMITGAFGGNVSQEFANYNSCWKRSHRQIAFIGDVGMVLYLAPGKHILHAAKNLKCGILPLGEVCEEITTKGLKWNLTNDSLQFGGLISSSNRTEDATVYIQISHPVLWTFDCDS